MFNIGIICGGPSKERGISLNSARSLYDNLGKHPKLNIKVVFVDVQMRKYLISQTFLYSNTTSDFDFKLETQGNLLTESSFIEELKECDIVFPAIHGTFGEDGQLQKILEENNIKYIGSDSNACKKMYNKFNAHNEILLKNNFNTVPKICITKEGQFFDNKLEQFITNNLECIIKPAQGGSSFGIEEANGIKEAKEKVEKLFKEYDELIVEKKCVGKEFTVIILENHKFEPVALIPTMIDCQGVFSTRRKYLSTTEAHYFCPPLFRKQGNDKIVEQIRNQAQELFKIAGAKDFVRIDGWLLDNDEIVFTDFNPISGMEQNSFLFQQGSKVGITHEDMLLYILKTACLRYGINIPNLDEDNIQKKQVNVLLGGWTSEKQVSLMSGTNVWLKLLHSNKYKSAPFLLFQENDKQYVMELPYSVALNHTVEEIMFQYRYMQNNGLNMELKDDIRKKLGIENKKECSIQIKKIMTLQEFIQKSKNEDAYVFLGLHGGFGENGTLQKMLEDADVKFNGSGSKAASIAMDKYLTGSIVNKMNVQNLRSAKKSVITREELYKLMLSSGFKEYWEKLQEEYKVSDYVIKPKADGCSTGIVILRDYHDLNEYAKIIFSDLGHIPPKTFYMQSEVVQLPETITQEYLIEEYIKVDEIAIKDKKIYHNKINGCVELTVGVLEKNGNYKSMNPSITIAQDGILSLAEKFQGGKGINITPPPDNIISKELLESIKANMEMVAKTVGVEDYCRIDIFANNITNEIIVIEINTLPGLSPSTVLFQQGVQEQPTLTPLELLEKIIE